MQEHDNFHAGSGKRLVLVVDDEDINQEILQAILQEDYEVALASDGYEALAFVREHADVLSLVVLDLIMPNMSGKEFLQRMKATPDFAQIPIIVASGDQSSEIDCLNLGAIDFIQKPYPSSGVILARCRRSIELSEDREIIRSTERDSVTGLYNTEYFYSYAEQFDNYHKDVATDAIILYVDHYTALQERYGREAANDIIRRIAHMTQDLVQDTGGIVTRYASDSFYIYTTHRDDYKAILDRVTSSVTEKFAGDSHARLCMGVYSETDRSLPIDRRFDRAHEAVDTIKDSLTRSIAVFDDTMLKAELYSQQLINDFPKALAKGEFKVYYQPKFDVQPMVPRLSGAEALVRWFHPELGSISPAVFIPLLEANGLVQQLDYYVWKQVAAQIRTWRLELGFCMPISVNVSRVDMYDTAVVDLLQDVLSSSDLDTQDLHLEFTESAYSQDSQQILETVKRLHSLGFKCAMDDFGTGYSSLNMLATLPIDALKLDRNFIKYAFENGEEIGTRMLTAITELAGNLQVPIVAEGVETKDELDTLIEFGCDTVQGFYFSEAVDANTFFERYLKGLDPTGYSFDGSAPSSAPHDLRDAVPRPMGNAKQMPPLSLKIASIIIMVVVFIIGCALFIVDSAVTEEFSNTVVASDNLMAAINDANSLQQGSDYLTTKVREYVVTGDIKYLNDYFQEIEVDRVRDKAVEGLTELLHGINPDALGHLTQGRALSDELATYEYVAMRLIADVTGTDVSILPQQIQDVSLTPQQYYMSPDQKRSAALDICFGGNYRAYKDNIEKEVKACTENLIAEAAKVRSDTRTRMERLLTAQTVLVVLIIITTIVIVCFLNFWVRRPLEDMVELMRNKKQVVPNGAKELRFVSETYNEVFEENQRRYDKLNYGSMHDQLTGLYNRKAYDIMCRDLDMEQNALLLVDVDKFKSVNDTYGHDVGDLVLVRVGEVLAYSFRSSDLVFRLGGDEFVVIMRDVDSSIRDVVTSKIDQANLMLQKPTGDLPPVSLSVGAAFGDRENPEGDIFKDADTALYRMKEGGRCGCVIY